MSRRVRLAWCLLVLALVAPAQGGVIEVQPGTLTIPGVNLCTALTGNVDTTNTMDRGNMRGAGLVRVVSTVGSTPTVVLNLLGSMDGTNFYNVAYSLQASPETVVVAPITITTATTNYYILRPFHPWRYFKANLSANTNVTLTIDAYASIN